MARNGSSAARTRCSGISSNPEMCEWPAPPVSRPCGPPPPSSTSPQSRRRGKLTRVVVPRHEAGPSRVSSKSRMRSRVASTPWFTSAPTTSCPSSPHFLALSCSGPLLGKDHCFLSRFRSADPIAPPLPPPPAAATSTATKPGRSRSRGRVTTTLRPSHCDRGTLRPKTRPKHGDRTRRRGPARASTASTGASPLPGWTGRATLSPTTNPRQRSRSSIGGSLIAKSGSHESGRESVVYFHLVTVAPGLHSRSVPGKDCLPPSTGYCTWGGIAENEQIQEKEDSGDLVPGGS